MASSMPSYVEFAADPTRSCVVIVHRGNWQAAPENSLLAIDRAIADGHDVVEIDVRKSVDGGFVLLHDDTLERMTGLDREPESMMLDELLRLKLRNRDGGKDNDFTGETLANLRDVFDRTRNNIYLHLDIKDRELIPEVIEVAKEMGVDKQVDFWGDLRTPDHLAWIREKIVPQDVAFIAKTKLQGDDARAQTELVFDLKPFMCEIYFNDLAQVAALKDRFQAAGISLWYNTLDAVSCAGFTDTAALADPDGIWGQLLDAGISAIQTDYPNELRAYLDGRTKVKAVG